MGKKIKAYVSVTNDLSTDNRVNKICSFLCENGHDVTLIGRKMPESEKINRAYKTKRFNLFCNKGPFFYAEYNFRLFFFLLFKKVTLLVSNDLDTLLANYAVSKFKPSAKLIYDSHEYFTESAELVDRKKVQSFWKGIEAWIFPKLKQVYTVNDSIANFYSTKYKVPVSVVRNAPPYWEDKNIPTKKELNLPEEKTLLIIQGTGININRGAEEAVLAMKNLKNCCLLIVGSGDVLPKLKELTRKEGLENRVLFFKKMPYKNMMHYTHHADIGLAIDKPICLNYKYALPNKVFDYMHAGTPIISTRLDEIEKLINTYQIGHVIDNFSVDSLIHCIEELILNKELLERMKENCKTAAKKENWENEILALHKIYSH